MLCEACYKTIHALLPLPLKKIRFLKAIALRNLIPYESRKMLSQLTFI